jgi:hypothetical protein
MAKYDKIIAGLVIQLPRGGTGVIIQATNIGKGWYRAVVVCYDCDVMLCKLKIQENGEDIDIKDVHYYDTLKASKALQNDNIKE